jgi:hypothetical protein
MVIANVGLVAKEIADRGWTRTKFAAEVGVHLRTVDYWLSGGPISHPNQVSLCRVLSNIPQNDLLSIVIDCEPAEAAS